MKLHLTFEEKDFVSLREFDKAVKKQLGNRVYVCGDYLCLYFDYPKELAAMLRPFPTVKQLEFDLESSLPDEKKK